MITTHYKANKQGFRGFIICKHNGKKLWEEYALVDRLNAKDAKSDAEMLKGDRYC